MIMGWVILLSDLLKWWLRLIGFVICSFRWLVSMIFGWLGRCCGFVGI